jgi:pseudouridine kinase
MRSEFFNSVRGGSIMNKQEAGILEMIKLNKLISLDELAEKSGVPISEVSEVITSLIQAGHITDETLILPQKKQILCIGGANMDRKIQVADMLEFGTSNPARSTVSCGGVARNIAENLGRLGLKTSLLSYIGADAEGEQLALHTKKYVDMGPTKVIDHKSTGTYTAVLDQEGEMVIAFADMAIYDFVDPLFLDKNWPHLNTAEMVLLDMNFPQQIIHEIIDRCKSEQLPLTIATVSASKVAKLPEVLHGVTWLIANQKEAEALSKINIRSEGDFFRAAEVILNKGAEKVVISRGNQGLIYFTKNGEAGALFPPETIVTDVTGAGDSLISGILFGHFKGLNTEDACKIGVTCSMLTIQSGETVNPVLNHQMLLEAFQKYFSSRVYTN